MDKLTRYMQNYLVYGFIPVVALIVITYFFNDYVNPSQGVTKLVMELLSYNMMFWFLTLIVFMFSLVFFSSVREKTLCRLANINERDEREAYITGQAARASYIATLSMTLLFLFFSLFSFHYSKAEQIDPNKPGHNISVSVGFNVFAEAPVVTQSATEMKPVFDSNKYSLSASTMMLILLVWQVLIFNLNARRLSK